MSTDIIKKERRKRANLISVIRIYILYLHAVLIKQPGPASHYDASKQHVHGKFHILFLESKFLETYLALEMSLRNA